MVRVVPVLMVAYTLVYFLPESAASSVRAIQAGTTGAQHITCKPASSTMPSAQPSTSSAVPISMVSAVPGSADSTTLDKSGRGETPGGRTQIAMVSFSVSSAATNV